MMLELILAAGLALLFASQRRLDQRLKRLERMLRDAQTPSGAETIGTGPGEAGSREEQGALSSPPPVRETMASLFENMVGGRLLIWIGGIALAAGGIFLIRQSIELITPETRMAGAALLGIALVGAGEYARGGRWLADDPRVAQALVGAGFAVLYATAYASHILFGLIGSGTTTALMLLITGAALLLSLRHGAPTAALGLVGGLLTPALVGDEQAGALPVFTYLALLDTAIFVIAWRRGWTWLAGVAVAGSFAWSGYFILESAVDALLAGLFAAALALLASLPPRQGRGLVFLQPATIGLLQLGGLVMREDLERTGWLLFGALAAASLPLARYRPEQRFAPTAALAIGLLLIAFKGSLGPDPLLVWAATGATVLMGAGCAWLVRRDAAPAITAAAALAGPLLILRMLRPETLPQMGWGYAALALAVAAFALLRLLRRRATAEPGPFTAGATVALLLAVAGFDLVPRDFVSGAWLLAAVALLAAGIRIPDKALRLAGLLLLTGTILKVFLIDAAALEGVLRILSFLGLGVALIGIGKFYGKVLNAERSART